MPLLKEHEENSTQRYGTPFTELHIWMDEPCKMLGGAHRKYRHDPNTTPVEAKKLFGENADNACLDHILLDKATSREKRVNREPNIGKNRSIRLGENLEGLIEQYSIFTGKKHSQIIREVVSEGLFQKTKFLQFQRFEEWIATREAFTLMTKCEKCGGEHDLGFFHIDGNINNTGANNMVTLCVPCLNAFQNWKMKQNIKEKFIEWFFA